MQFKSISFNHICWLSIKKHQTKLTFSSVGERITALRTGHAKPLSTILTPTGAEPLRQRNQTRIQETFKSEPYKFALIHLPCNIAAESTASSPRRRLQARLSTDRHSSPSFQPRRPLPTGTPRPATTLGATPAQPCSRSRRRPAPPAPPPPPGRCRRARRGHVRRG